MQAKKEVDFWMKLAEGFLQEAQEDFSLRRWRSGVDNSQLATKNTAKAVLAILGPVGRTHNPSSLLRQVVAGGRELISFQAEVTRLAECAELLGADIHVQSDYGDEAGGQTPWELFDEDAAQKALHLAEEAVRIAQVITQDAL